MQDHLICAGSRAEVGLQEGLEYGQGRGLVDELREVLSSTGDPGQEGREMIV